MITTHSLFPGVTLRCWQDSRFKQGRLSLQFVRPMSSAEASYNALLPAVLLRGTLRHPDLRSITCHLDQLYGASVSDLVRRVGDYQTTGFYCTFTEDRFALPGDRILSPVVEFLKELLFEPILENGGFSSEFTHGEKRNLLSDLEAVRNDKQAYAAAQLLRTMCFADSFGTPRLGSKETLLAVDEVSLYRHYQQLLKHSAVELFYVGSQPAEEIARLVAPLFSDLDRCYVNLSAQTPFHDGGQRREREKMDLSQSWLEMGFTTDITNQSPEFAAMQTLNALFGAGMTSKLFMTVREKLSLCYSISSGYYGSKGILTVAAGIDRQQEDTVRQEVLRQLQLCRDAQITDQELESARQALLSGLRSIHDSPGSIESYYATAALSGFPDTPDTYRQRILSVTGEDVAAAARRVQLHSEFFLEGL